MEKTLVTPAGFINDFPDKENDCGNCQNPQCLLIYQQLLALKRSMQEITTKTHSQFAFNKSSKVISTVRGEFNDVEKIVSIAEKKYKELQKLMKELERQLEMVFDQNTGLRKALQEKQAHERTLESDRHADRALLEMKEKNEKEDAPDTRQRANSTLSFTWLKEDNNKKKTTCDQDKTLENDDFCANVSDILNNAGSKDPKETLQQTIRQMQKTIVELEARNDYLLKYIRQRNETQTVRHKDINRLHKLVENF